jgi:two-component system chemotaxis sensor kinase CheA
MHRISELTEQLASAVLMADPDDLPALAQMHEQLRTVGQLVSELTDIDVNQAAGLRDTASSAEKLVEQIILREVEDGAAAIKTVGKAVADLQQLIMHGAHPAAGRAATPPSAAQPASAAHDAPPKAAALPDDAPINPNDVSLVIEFIAESAEHIQTAEASLLQLEETPGDNEALNAIFRSFHTIKGVAGFLNLGQMGALAHAAESLLDLARHGEILLEGAVADVILEAIDVCKLMIASLKDAANSQTAPPNQPALPALLERLRAVAAGTPQPAGQPASPAARQSAAPTAPPGPAAQPKAAPGANAAGGPSASGEATVKVATDRLDNLINMVGELVIAQSMVSQDVRGLCNENRRLGRNVSHLGKITRELQDLSMSMRMVPIQGVFHKMARLVRDLARKALKEIDFATVGGETELDRNVVEVISDPLVHMVRNCVDHGVEPPDERLRLGKPRSGHVQLKAYHQAGNIVIEVSDDGRGLSKGTIVKKARDAGIIRDGQELSEQEVFKLIFHAGLTTAEKITDISGRGVGMDVVRRNVEALRGRIDIASTEGKGSTFTIRLPLTLAIIDGQIVKVGPERFIIPITSEQSIQPKARQLSTVQNRGEMCMVRGNLLPLCRLYRLFNLKPLREDPTQSLGVIVQDGQSRCCLVVDELFGQEQVVIKSLGEGMGHIPGISGGAILGDGNVSLILDVPGLIQMASGR